MKISEGWNEIEARDSLENNVLKLGGHVCRIIDVSNHISNNNKPCLRVIYDIDEGSKYDNYFQKLVDNRTTDDERWPNEGTKYIPVEEKYLGYLKYVIGILDISNNTHLEVIPGEELDLSQFKGLKFGGVFGLKEYAKNGEVKKSITLENIKRIDEIKDIAIPDVKLIDGTSIPYEEYIKSSQKLEPVQQSMNLNEEHDVKTNEETHEIMELEDINDDYPFE